MFAHGRRRRTVDAMRHDDVELSAGEREAFAEIAGRDAERTAARRHDRFAAGAVVAALTLITSVAFAAPTAGWSFLALAACTTGWAMTVPGGLRLGERAAGFFDDGSSSIDEP